MKYLLLILSLFILPTTSVSAQSAPSDQYMSIVKNNAKATSFSANYSCEISLSGMETEVEGNYSLSLNPYEYSLNQRVEEGNGLGPVSIEEKSPQNQAQIKDLLEKRDEILDQTLASYDEDSLTRLFNNYFYQEYDDGLLELKLNPASNKSAFRVDFAGLVAFDLLDELFVDQVNTAFGGVLSDQEKDLVKQIAQTAIINTQDLEIKFNTTNYQIQSLDWSVLLTGDLVSEYASQVNIDPGQLGSGPIYFDIEVDFLNIN